MKTYLVAVLFVISLVHVAGQSPPFTRLTTQIAGAPSTTQVLTPQTTIPQVTSPYTSYSPDQLGSSTLTFPQSLNTQLNMPNVNMAGLSQPSFTDPFAPAASSAPANTGSLSSILPAGLGSSINSLTSPFTTALSGPGNSQASPVTSTLSNLFGPATTTTTSSTSPFNSMFGNPAPAQSAPSTTASNSLFPIDSSNLLFPSSFSPSAPATTQSQALSQLSTFSAQAPIISGTNAGPQAPFQPQAPTQPQIPSSPFGGSSGPVAPVAPSSSAFAPPSGFSSAAINPPAGPNTFNTQAAPRAPQPSISNSSPFSASAPVFPSSPASPAAPSTPQLQQPGVPQAPGQVLLESGSSTKPVAGVVLSRAAPVISTNSLPPSLSSPFPSSPSVPSSPSSPSLPSSPSSPSLPSSSSPSLPSSPFLSTSHP